MSAICLVVQAFYETDVRVRRKAEALVEAGYSVDVLALRVSGDRKRFVLNGVDVRTMSLGKQRGTLARYAFEYAAFFLWTMVTVPVQMRRRRYAVIDVNTLPDFLIFAAVFGRWLGARLLLDMHEITPEFYISKYGVSERSWIVRTLKFQERASFNFADSVVTIHEPIEDLLVGRGLRRAKSTIVMNSADAGRFHARTVGAADDEGPAPSARFAMIYHGTLTKIYGLDIAVEAFGHVRDQMPGAELWILGGGPEAARLAAMVDRLGLSEQVKLIGQVPPGEIPAWLRRATVGILPLRRDVFLDYAFPNKLPEMIISEKAVIVSRLKAIRHYFSEDALAYAAPNDPIDLGRQMVRLYRDPSLRTQLCWQAKKEYEAIGWDVMKRRYVDLVGRLAAGPAGSPGAVGTGA